ARCWPTAAMHWPRSTRKPSRRRTARGSKRFLHGRLSQRPQDEQRRVAGTHRIRLVGLTLRMAVFSALVLHMPHESLTLDELAAQLGRDRRELEKLVSRGRIPGRRVDGIWRFHPAEIRMWLEQEMRGYNTAELA